MAKTAVLTKTAKPQVKNVTDADSLDDGLLYDMNDTAFASDDEGDGAVAISPNDVNDDGDAVEEGTTKSSEGAKEKEEEKKLQIIKKAEKRKRMKERMKEKKRQRMQTEVTVKTSIATTSPTIISDYFAKKARLFFPELSAVEIDDQCVVKENQILDMASWNLPRDDSHFEKFLLKAAKPRNLTETPKKKGSPYILILSISAIRVCQVRRAIPKTIKSAKLISKNSIASDSTFLSNSSLSAVLSTPERLTTVLNRAAISLDNLELVVIDSSFLDSKARSVIDDVAETLRTVKRLTIEAPNAKVVLY
ncbi:U3-containing 90S pre-ribosomal complex subunit-domain containing protein [Kockiozyma suomiensis]|uniref:U3-containing 90S pre-ribosomal complex subunit-domain containing protein n=1 Tax=Kockiozyma suomiensis TaxID=1337062 RepID=UPI0033441809